MTQTVDARGQKCPVPLVLTKKVFDGLVAGEEMIVLIDNVTSAKNVETFIEESGGTVGREQKEGEFVLRIIKGEQTEEKRAEDYCGFPAKPHIIFINSDSIGDAKELGQALMQSFLQTIKDIIPLPSHCIFINLGVTLLGKGTKTAEAICELETLGVEIVACGTCLDFYNFMEKRATGRISNMYEILSLTTQASKVIKP